MFQIFQPFAIFRPFSARPIRPSLPALPAIGPGPTTGYYDEETDTGYYGYVAPEDLITGDALATSIGLTAGTTESIYADSSLASDHGWFKFYIGPTAICNRDGIAKVIYTAKRPMRHSITWDELNALGIIYGDTTVTIDSNQFKVRLLTGADADPATYSSGTTCAQNPGDGSEWNDLLYRIHIDAPTCDDIIVGMSGGNETTRHGGPQTGANWAAMTESEIIVHTTEGRGSYSWCQETVGSSAVVRGFGGIARYFSSSKSIADVSRGWRPVLELIQP